MNLLLSTCPLTGEQIRSYREDGYLILPSFFDNERIEAVLDEADLLRRTDLVDPLNLRCRFMPSVKTGEPLFEVFDPIIDISPASASLAHDAQLYAVLHALYGEPASLFKDKLIYKPPGARGYGIHQDWISWPGFPRSFLTVLVALDEADVSNGCTRVYSGMHRNGCLAPENGEYHQFSPDDMGIARRIDLELEPGDIAIFTGFTPHCSEANLSSQDRRQLFLSYNAQSDGGDLRAWHYADFQRRRRQSSYQDSPHAFFR
ncbi:MAG: phytanoyl-CoA dioxygenase family protein [Planctomycetes bacterium]|nr:phytanoyl-CoA dioxygenase family protein [Planctomycetota bacterium]